MARNHARIWLDINTAPEWRREGKNAPWFVYTLHAAERRVRPPLYVGVTGRLYERLINHRRHQAWWPLAGRLSVIRFDNRSDAYEAEHDLIATTRPLFNIAGNPHSPAYDDFTEVVAAHG